MTRYVRIVRFCELTGLTEKAVREKIRTGAWAEGIHYRRAPDGHIVIDLQGYEAWIEGRAVA